MCISELKALKRKGKRIPYFLGALNVEYQKPDRRISKKKILRKIRFKIP